MSQQVVLSGTGTVEHGNALCSSLVRARPQVVGVAAAFVSIEGVRNMLEYLRRCGSPNCRLIAGTDHAVTHPEALYAARDAGWLVRLGRSSVGIFHPKLVVAGRRFARNGCVQQPCCVYVGSSNLTRGGLSANVECGLLAEAGDCPLSAADAFGKLWATADQASDDVLRHYAARFADNARRRSASELADLGIGDSRFLESSPTALQSLTVPSQAALSEGFAVSAWTGLQSFTGEYRFQIEFPKNAGKVINRLIRASVQADGRIDVYCPDDGSTREMQYRFYQDNGMFRLNVPNDVPGVAWARANRDGIAIVEPGPPGGAPLRLRILRPGTEVTDIVGRSVALGTWGKTTTRSYGWF